MQSINRPGGNITGISVFSIQLVAKRLELARELSDKSGLVAFLVNPDNPNSQINVKEMERIAQGLAQPLVLLRASNEADCDVAFASLES